MKPIPKFQNSGKVFINEGNRSKQRFLNEHGVKVKIDGSWGPWQQEQYDKLTTQENNKRKQQFLNLNGIKVKTDGRWGPWQEQQYEKLTTKDKYYHPTILGLFSYLYDKTLGNGTTYQEDPTFVKPGEIWEDDRSAVRRYLDQQMQNHKTPLGFITQNVLPAAAVSGAIVYGGPAIAKGFSTAAIANGIRTAVSNPSTILHATKPLVKEGVKGAAGATAVNLFSKATTGKTWGEQVAQSTGVSPELGEFTNVGAYAPTYLKNVAKRGVETAMRTTRLSDPANIIINNMKRIIKRDPKRAAAIGAYTLTGIRLGNKGYYNSFALNPNSYYSGFFPTTNNTLHSSLPENDLIDAFLYKKPISPKFGVKKLGTKDYGVHTDYVKQHYPDKNIQIYETLPSQDLRTVPAKDIPKVPVTERVREVEDIWQEEQFRTNEGWIPNAAGHLEELSYDLAGHKMSRRQDIWKFNPDEYIAKWGKFGFTKPSYTKLGLKIVDHLGTPVITRTSWMPH